MNFTNTDCVGEDIYWHFDGQQHGQVNCQVNCQVWQMYDQINLIKFKITQEINK